MGGKRVQAQVLIQIDENPNCAPMDGLVFQPRMVPRPVSRVRTVHLGTETWCDITGLTESGAPTPAMACLIEDSGDGASYLVFGAAWGLRCKIGQCGWDLNDPDQWGEVYVLLPADGSDLHFAAPAQ
jgi:hypothetical protein